MRPLGKAGLKGAPISAVILVALGEAKFGGLIDAHNGREGKVRLIIGMSEPKFAIAAGHIERWRIVNASSLMSMQAHSAARTAAESGCTASNQMSE